MYTILLRVFKFLVDLDIYNVISCSTLNIFSLVYTFVVNCFHAKIDFLDLL